MKHLVLAALSIVALATPASAHWHGGWHSGPDVVRGGYYDSSSWGWDYYPRPAVVVVPAVEAPCIPLVTCHNPAKTRIVYIHGVAWADCGYGALVKPGTGCPAAVQQVAVEPSPTASSGGTVIRDRPADGCESTDYNGKTLYICPK